MDSCKDILLLSDMDGTLLNSSRMVSDRNRNAIQQFIMQGGKFGVATGRGMQNAAPYLEGIELSAYSIYYNGAILYDSKNQKAMVEKYVEKEQMIPLLRKCLSERPEIGVQIYSDDRCFVISQKAPLPDEILKLHKPYCFADLDMMLDKSWIKVLFYGNAKQKAWVEEQVEMLVNLGLVSGMHSSKEFYEIVPTGVSKGSMLKELRTLAGADCVIYAVGDYYNDLEMIQEADIGVVPANAPDDLKQYADKVVCSCDEGALADLIYSMLL